MKLLLFVWYSNCGCLSMRKALAHTVRDFSGLYKRLCACLVFFKSWAGIRRQNVGPTTTTTHKTAPLRILIEKLKMWAKIFFELGDPYFLLRFRAVEHFCDRFTVRIFQNEDRGQILWEILFAKVSAKIVIKIRGNFEKLAICSSSLKSWLLWV